jgi:hypothetical protein
MSTSSAPSPSRAQIVARVAVGLLGGWLFVWGFVALGITLMSAAGMGFGDAQTLAFLLAFLIYLVALLWGFATASLARAACVLIGGGALMSGLAWLLSRQA